VCVNCKTKVYLYVLKEGISLETLHTGSLIIHSISETFDRLMGRVFDSGLIVVADQWCMTFGVTTSCAKMNRGDSPSVVIQS
jgi:hypothetical protein